MSELISSTTGWVHVLFKDGCFQYRGLINVILVAEGCYRKTYYSWGNVLLLAPSCLTSCRGSLRGTCFARCRFHTQKLLLPVLDGAEIRRVRPVSEPISPPPVHSLRVFQHQLPDLYERQAEVLRRRADWEQVNTTVISRKSGRPVLGGTPLLGCLSAWWT
jgi:hypothetical protein